jgi:hypothetical protein
MPHQIETSSCELHSQHDLSSQPPEQSAQPQPQLLITEIDNTAAAEVNYQYMHPIDKGFAAWRLLWTAFVFEALLWGASSSCVDNISLFASPFWVDY